MTSWAHCHLGFLNCKKPVSMAGKKDLALKTTMCFSPSNRRLRMFCFFPPKSNTLKQRTKVWLVDWICLTDMPYLLLT
jgi:hypothetical protein